MASSSVAPQCVRLYLSLSHQTMSPVLAGY
jgi:hypothetical protein